MKYIGFIKELDDFPWASSLSQELGEPDNPAELIDRIMAWLQRGKLICGWMSYFIDLETKAYIEPHGYYSDGEWVWPAYYPYYLTKYPNYKIDQAFVDHVLSKDLTSAFVFDERAVERELISRIENK